MTNIDFSYVNYAHGGSDHGSWFGTPGSFQFEGLVRLLGDEDRWPDVAVVGEAERWGFDGGAGMYGAAAALSDASGRPYLPVLGSLPRESGPVGPAMFVDAQKVRVKNWYAGHEPDFYARNRNCLRARLAGRPEEDFFHVVSGHGDIFDELLRLSDAKALRRYASPQWPCAILMDWNAPLSGFEKDDFSAYTELWQFISRTVFEHGPAQGGPYRADTMARDYLCGWKDPVTGARVGGLGFVDVLELAGLHDAVTNFPHRSGRQCQAIDGAVVNSVMAPLVVLDSVHVHEPADPENPDTDHKRVSFAADL